MRKIQFLFLASSFTISLFSQQRLSISVNQNLTELRTDDHTEYLGLVPEPVTVDYTNYQSNLKTTSLPNVYDLRLTGGITSVKNQGSCGSCWLFPSMGAVESRWKHLGLGDYDLSEDNLKHCHNYSYSPCQGGNRLMATAYFSRGKGPVLEAQDPYSASSATGCPVGITPVANVTEAWFLPNKSIVDIKQAIYNYGAVYNTFYWNSKWYNSSTKVYCQTRDTSETNNHAVLIVGWNDNIVTPLGTGAWIIKNSWGSTWGESGFFYLSYQDKRAMQDPTIWMNRSDYNTKQIFHGYDDLGWNSSLGGAKTSYGVVKFTAGTNQIIKQIATYAVAPNTNISAEIYTNFSGSTFSGLLGTVPAKTFKYAGYYTLNLANEINLNANTTYYVKYKIVNQTSFNPLAVESQISGYTDKAIIETGKCWYSTNNFSWTPIGANTSKKFDLCLKVIAEESCDFLKSTITQTLTNLCSSMSTTLTANSNVSGVTYQWQLSTSNGANWSNVVPSTKYLGTQTSKLIIKNVLLNFDNTLYRCNVTSSCNSVYSNTSLLRVTSAPVVIQHPANVTTPLNTLALFSVSVSNPSNCLYQWQVNNTGATWANLVDNSSVAGSNTNELVVSANSIYQNKQFRCRLKSSCNSTFIYSNNALLNIGTGIVNSTPTSSFKTDNEHEEDLISDEALLVNEFALYPNPANDVIYLSYATEMNSYIEISIYDVLGQVVENVVNNDFEIGNYTTEVNTANIKNGTYLVMFTTKYNNGKVVQLHKRLVVNH